MQTVYTILSIAHRIHFIKHCKQNTLYSALKTEYTILRILYIKQCKQTTLYQALQREYTILSIANRIQNIKHCTQNTLH